MTKFLVISASILLGIVMGIFGFSSFDLIYKVLIVLAFSLLYIVSFILLFLFTFFESKSKDRQKQSKYFRKVFSIYNHFLLDLFSMKIYYSGIEKLDEIGQFLLISNHRSNLDSLVMG